MISEKRERERREGVREKERSGEREKREREVGYLVAEVAARGERHLAQPCLRVAGLGSGLWCALRD